MEEIDMRRDDVKTNIHLIIFRVTTLLRDKITLKMKASMIKVM